MPVTIPDTTAFTAAYPFAQLPLVLHFPEGKRLTEDEYYDFCMANPDLRLEQAATGEIIIMSPTGGGTSDRNSEINMQLRMWAKRDGTGKAFESNAEFRLPKGSARSPDASWVKLSRWNRLSVEEQEVFPPLCPEFVLELRSKSDRLTTLQKKLVEYIDNGAQLGWIVDPLQKQVHVYRPGQAPVILDQPTSVSGDPELPGLVLDLREIWPAQ